jgi:hypothetical protein
LRAARRTWRLEEKSRGDGRSTEYGIDCEIDNVVGWWRFVGMGYTTAGDTWLAESIAEEERLARRFGYEERHDVVEAAE